VGRALESPDEVAAVKRLDPRIRATARRLVDERLVGREEKRHP
jgi:hypothetical protein